VCLAAEARREVVVVVVVRWPVTAHGRKTARSMTPSSTDGSDTRAAVPPRAYPTLRRDSFVIRRRARSRNTEQLELFVSFFASGFVLPDADPV